MRAMRNAKFELEAMTEAIVNDPLVEWTKGVANTKGSDIQMEVIEEDKDVGESKWERRQLNRKALSLKFNPIARVNLFRDKLNGRHPSHIMSDEMKATEQPKVRQNLTSYLRLVHGPDSQRADVAAIGCKNLDVDTQVDCLIDIATDKEILSRSWIGLQAWL